MTSPISRRTLLRAGGTGALAALLVACADDGDPSDAGTTGEDGTAAAGSGTEADVLTIIIPTFEVITGADGRVPMGILGGDMRPILDASPTVTILREGEVVAEGLQPVFYGEGLGDRGIYVIEPDLAQPGIHDVVVTVPGSGTGEGVFAAVAPEDAQVHAPGQEFPSLSTPTSAAPGPMERLCTQDPPCSMHETSLDEAMAAGPVVLTVATPQFCQTAVCGPVVSVVEAVRDEAARDDVAFIHVEVFTDEGVTVAPVVEELGLPTEPWTWVIDADGVVVDRYDGPVVPSMLAESVAAL